MSIPDQHTPATPHWPALPMPDLPRIEATSTSPDQFAAAAADDTAPVQWVVPLVCAVPLRKRGRPKLTQDNATALRSGVQPACKRRLLPLCAPPPAAPESNAGKLPSAAADPHTEATGADAPAPASSATAPAPVFSQTSLAELFFGLRYPGVTGPYPFYEDPLSAAQWADFAHRAQQSPLVLRAITAPWGGVTGMILQSFAHFSARNGLGTGLYWYFGRGYQIVVDGEPVTDPAQQRTAVDLLRQAASMPPLA